MHQTQSRGADDRRAQDKQWVWLRARSEDSNVAADWLWLYTQLDDDAQRLYSLRRAVEIDPCDRAVRRLLARLEQVLSRRSAAAQPCVQN